MGFSWAKSSEALKAHGSLEEAVEALFAADAGPGPAGNRGDELIVSLGSALVHLFSPLQCHQPGSEQRALRSRRKMTMRGSGSSCSDALLGLHRAASLMLRTKPDPNQSPRPAGVLPKSASIGPGYFLKCQQFLFTSVFSSFQRSLSSVWVGTLAPSMTYVKLHELFSR